MSKRLVLNVSRQAEWLHAFTRAKQELHWDPIYWITYPQNHSEVLQAFPDVIAHPRLELNRGVLPERFNRHQYGSLSVSELNRAEYYIATALMVFDRFDLDHSMSHPARLRLIHKLLAYWHGVIEELELNLAVFSASPHAIGNYLMYAAMKLAGKQTLIFKLSSVANINFIDEQIEGVPKRIAAKAAQILAGTSPAKTSAPALEAITRIREAKPDHKPWYVAASSERDERKQSIIDAISKAYSSDLVVRERFLPGTPLRKENGEFIRRRRRNDGEVEVPRTFKVPGRALNDRMITKQEYEDYRDWAMTQKFALREEYERLCSDPKSDKPFVYLALHYQPEKTTAPESGYFAHQYQAAAALAAGIPSGWEVLVKEHPSQFRYTAMGELGRWPGYYEDFVGLGNVRFVGLDASSIEIFDRPHGVATMVGTVGWEALVRGTPALCFGSAWYSACEGAYPITSKEDVESACAAIIDGHAPSAAGVEAYVAALEKFGRSVYTSPSQAAAVTLEENMGDLYFDILLDNELREQSASP